MKNIFFIICLIVCQIAWAQQADETENSGLAVKVNNTYYLLDLLESGLENSASVGQANKWTAQDPLDVESALQQMGIESAELKQALRLKIYDIFIKWPRFAAILVSKMNQQNWSWINLPLRRVDYPNSTIDLKPYEVVQAAIRRASETTITVNKTALQQLSVTHQVALILHETVGAFLASDTKAARIDTSGRVLTAMLMNPAIQDNSKWDWFLINVAGYFMNSIHDTADLGPEDYILVTSDKYAKDCENYLHEVEAFWKRLDTFISLDSVLAKYPDLIKNHTHRTIEHVKHRFVAEYWAFAFNQPATVSPEPLELHELGYLSNTRKQPWDQIAKKPVENGRIRLPLMQSLYVQKYRAESRWKNGSWSEPNITRVGAPEPLFMATAADVAWLSHVKETAQELWDRKENKFIGFCGYYSKYRGSSSIEHVFSQGFLLLPKLEPVVEQKSVWVDGTEPR